MQLLAKIQHHKFTTNNTTIKIINFKT